MTPYGTLAFPNVFEPRAVTPGSEPRFSINLIFDEKQQRDPKFKAIQDAIMEAAHEKFGNKLPPNLRMPIRKAEEKSEYEGFLPGHVFLGAWTKERPGIVDAANNEILTKAEVWAGQLARAFIKPFGYDNSGNKGVSFMLEHIQIVDGEKDRIDGRKKATEVFGAIDSDSIV
jgi:hypothetical protein